MISKKYIVMPGHIHSVWDEDLHYVGPMTLMRYYGVNPDECLVITDAKQMKDLLGRFKVLTPQQDFGKYKVDKCAEAWFNIRNEKGELDS